jgi:autotransporter-associated beta strand protein
MLAASFRSLLRRTFTRRPAPARRKFRCRPSFEALEDRLVLSTVVWDGSADGSGVPFANANWTSPQNWVGDVAPQPGDDLVFPATALQQTATNDFPAGTAFHSIHISGTGWTLNGNAVSLAAGISTSNASGANTVTLPLTLTAPQTFLSGTAASDLVLSGATIDNGGFALTVSGPGDAFFSGGAIVGIGGLVKNGPGQFILGDTAPNTYTGGTTVNGGSLLLNGTAGDAVPGPLTVGGGSVGPTTGIARLAAANQVADAAAVTVNGSGLFDLNGFTDTIGPLTLYAGKVTTGTGLLTLNGDVTTLAAGGAATIRGHLDLGAAAARTFTIANGTSGTDLDIAATISGAPGVALVKQGPGTLRLRGDDNYAGPTLVSRGTLTIASATALGATSAGTTVSVGASLVVVAPAGHAAETFAAEPLVLDGGTLASGSGNNTWVGPIQLTGPSALGAAAGTGLTVTATISGPACATLTKVWDGTVLLTAANTYAGETVVCDGTLAVRNATALGSPTGTSNLGTRVHGGATLELRGGLTFDPTEALTLDGGSSLRDGSGNDTWAGTVQLARDRRRWTQRTTPASPSRA